MDRRPRMVSDLNAQWQEPANAAVDVRLKAIVADLLIPLAWRATTFKISSAPRPGATTPESSRSNSPNDQA